MIGFVIGMQILLLFVLVYVLHKVRRVHQATFRLNDRMGAETNGLFAQVEALVALYYGLRFRQPLPSMRRFAALAS